MVKKEITLKEVSKEFIIFLKENNAYEKFKQNIRQQKHSIYQQINPNPFMDVIMCAYEQNLNEKQTKRDFIASVSSIIDHSLIWANTKEGHEFWRNLNRKWSIHSYNIFNFQTI